MNIGEKIKELRMERGLTLEEIGNRVGVGKSTVRKWETGQIANMRSDKIELIASALNVTPQYLMGWNVDKTKANKKVLGNNLSYFLEKKGTTQKEFSEIVGVSAPTVTEWIKGKKYPRIDKIEIMANYFGVQKSDLIEDKSKDSSASPSVKILMNYVQSLSEEEADRVYKAIQLLLGDKK